MLPNRAISAIQGHISLEPADIGFIELIVLEKAKKLINSDSNNLVKDGCKWVIKTHSEWSSEFCFIPERLVIRAIKNLVKNGILVCKCKWYSLREI